MTNGQVVYTVCPQKKKVNQTRLTINGREINSEGNCSTPTANLLTVKLLFNNIVSIPGAKSLGLDLKDFYLNTPMDCPEFLQMKISNFLDDVIDHYGLLKKGDKHGFLFIRVEQGIYGLLHT